MTVAPAPRPKRGTSASSARLKERAGQERWIAVVRLGVVPFLLVQMVLVPPPFLPAIVAAAAVLTVSGATGLALHVKRPQWLADESLRIAFFAVDCLAFAAIEADYASPGDLTWVTFILVLLSAATRWDVRGAVAAVVVFVCTVLPFDVLTPAYTHLRFDLGSITFKLGLIALLAMFFALQFRGYRRVSDEHENQSQALRRQTETILRSQGQLRALFDTALTAIITMDQEGVVRDWNRRAEEMFGWLKGEVVGTPLVRTIIPEQHRAAHSEGLRKYRESGQGPVLGKVLDLTALHRDGREFPIELSIAPASTVEGRTSFIAFLRDITERKRAEALQALQVGVTTALSEARDIEEAAPRVLEELGLALGLALAQWWDVEPAREVLTWRESWFERGLSAVDFIHDSQAMTFRSGEGLPGQVWKSGHTRVIPDLASDPGFGRVEGAAQAGLVCAAALPILNGLEVTGVIELYGTTRTEFDDEALHALASVGSQVGQFVQRRRAEVALQAAGERITGVLENVVDGIVTMDEEGRIQTLNAAARRLFAYLPDEVLGAPIDTLVLEPEREHFLERLLAQAGPGSARAANAALETVGRRMDGSAFPVEMRASEMTLAGQRIFIVSMRDISERKAQTEALQYQALHDALTGLPNRTLLGDRLRQAISASARDQRPLALLILDLDRFKEVNDSMGHEHGDLLLQQVASRIRDLLRGADTVARLGGDEFAILPSGATAREGATRTAQKVARAFEKPFVIDDRSFDIRPSIGIALYPEHGDDAETLMRRADVAMYVAKRGKKSHAIYEPAHDQDTALRLALMSELRHAADRDEMLLLYQPKIDLRTDEVVGVEALLRWVHPERGTLAPDKFLVFAEQTELIHHVTRWVVETALRQARAWMDAGLELGMAINMSARNLHDAELPGTVARLLTTWKVPAELLTMEITEGMAMDGAAEERLQELGAMGVRLSIDDFGTGYSSLAYLKRLPMEELKIDRSFVSSMDVNPDDAAIVRPTVDLGHNLGLRVTAEGVESEATLEMLRNYGCDFAQGHYLCAPMGAAELTAWLKSRPRGAARPLGAPRLRALEGKQA